MTKSDSLLFCGSLDPGRTVGWFGGAGPLGGGGARMLDREVELGGSFGAGRKGFTGLICGLKLGCNCAKLLPCIDCPPRTARCKIGPMERKTGIKNNHQQHHILQVICERVTPSKYYMQYPQNLKVWSKEVHTTQLEYEVQFTRQYGVHFKPQTGRIIILRQRIPVVFFSIN